MIKRSNIQATILSDQKSNDPARDQGSKQASTQHHQSERHRSKNKGKSVARRKSKRLVQDARSLIIRSSLTVAFCCLLET
jgi:hypothetical protein